jgi:hypothetical protein
MKAKIVLPTKDATWVRELDLPFPPFPGLGIRVDAYEMLNVRGVVVGDLGFDVTCIVELEGTNSHKANRLSFHRLHISSRSGGEKRFRCSPRREKSI